MNRIEEIVSNFIIPIFIVATAVLVLLMISLSNTSRHVDETSAYTRVSNCIVAKLAGATIPQIEIEKCYVQVEKETGISLERFDMQTHNENVEIKK